MAENARTRALVHLPAAVQRGVPFEVRAMIAHPMENGLRSDGYGNVVPRNVLSGFECRIDQRVAFAADLYPAIAANPYLAFWLRIDGPAALSFEWTGDNGFTHRELRQLMPA